MATRWGHSHTRAACALALVAAALGAVPALGAQARHNRSAPALEREARALVAMRSGPPAVVVVVQRFGQVRVYRAGVSDLRSRERPGFEDHMRIASLSKAFSAAVALALVDHGVLSLGDRIGKWLPWLPRRWHRVTLRELLGHTSGLPDFSSVPAFNAYLVKHLHARPAPRFMLSFVTDRPLAFAPGSRYRYSNTDNFVAALMAERATRRSYVRLLSSLIYKPLGLVSTSLPASAAMPRPYRHGYDVEPPDPPVDVSTQFSASYSWASGGIVSNPAELNRFIRGYAGAKLFGRRVQRQQLRLVNGSSDPEGPGRNMAGLGIFRYATRCGTIWGHTGTTPGYTQFAAATLGGQRSVTVTATESLTESQTGAKPAAFKRLRALESDAVCAALR